MAECAQDIKKVSLELGGNAPLIVFDDADLDKAVDGAIVSTSRNNGQTCVCVNRQYVQDGVYDAFVDKLKAAVAKLATDNGLDESSSAGPMPALDICLNGRCEFRVWKLGVNARFRLRSQAGDIR